MSLFEELGLKFGKDPNSETKKLIQDSEKKRDALLSALDQEEQRLNMADNEEFEAIGRYFYLNRDELAVKGILLEEVNPKFESIMENANKREELKAKRESVVSRYSEEIDILKSSMVVEEAPNKPEEEIVIEDAPYTGSFCPNCGAPVKEGINFCGACGTKLN
ncbi:MAG: zinc ribbon domain-containing protein [Firmicutes bacterium]|nr:zinc ribbon domain-containing protein [Bacillota bacterium]